MSNEQKTMCRCNKYFHTATNNQEWHFSMIWHFFPFCSVSDFIPVFGKTIVSYLVATSMYAYLPNQYENAWFLLAFDVFPVHHGSSTMQAFSLLRLMKLLYMSEQENVCVRAFKRVWRKSNEWLYNFVSCSAHKYRHFGLVSLSTTNTNNRRSIMYQKLNSNFNMCFNDMTSLSVFPIHSIHINSFSQWMDSSIAFEAGIRYKNKTKNKNKSRNNGIQSYKMMPIHWSLRRKCVAHTRLACHWSEYLRTLCHFWGIH